MKSQVKKILAVAVAAVGIAAGAAPTVRITDIKLADAKQGIATYTYKVSGVGENPCAITFTLSAQGCDKTSVITAGNVANGSVTTNVNYRQLLGGAYPNITLIAKIRESVQLWEGGPYFDTCNVGANAPEEAGYYFWWGDTVGYVRNAANDGWVSVDGKGATIQFSSSDATAKQTDQKTNQQLKDLGFSDDASTGVLNAAHDAATAHLGAPWRMMTEAELQKLTSTAYCRRTWVTTYNGKSVSGYVVKGNAGSPYENNEVFFPAAGNGSGASLSNSGSYGNYWSSTPYAGDSYDAWYLYFGSSYFYRYNNYLRYYGRSVRAVRGFAK